MGFGFSGASTTAAHQHSAAASDGGVLSETITIMETPDTAQQWAIVKAVSFS